MKLDDDLLIDPLDEVDIPHVQSKKVTFHCPKCGVIPEDEVAFLCNTCAKSELIFQEGMYMCPSCLTPGNNFQCMRCDSKEVVMKFKHTKKS